MHDETTALTPEEVGEWLGLRPGESIESAAPDQPEPLAEAKRPGLGLASLGLAAMLIVPGWLRLIGAHGLLAVLACFLGGAVMMVGVMRLARAEVAAGYQPWRKVGDPSVRADHFGLTFTYPRRREPIHVAWTALESVVAQYGEIGPDGVRRVERWGLYCALGAFHLRADAPHADRILNAVRQVLAAKADGRPLWDLASVPASGLSRMEGEAELADDESLSLSHDV